MHDAPIHCKKVLKWVEITIDKRSCDSYASTRLTTEQALLLLYQLNAAIRQLETVEEESNGK